MFPNAIEVFDLAESEDMLSPVEIDPEKLTHKFKEVRGANSLLSSCSDLTTEIQLERRKYNVQPDKYLYSGQETMVNKRCNSHAFAPPFSFQLQIKHAVTQAEIQQLKRKVRTSQRVQVYKRYSDDVGRVNTFLFALCLLQLAHAEQEKLRWRMEKTQLEQTVRETKERMEKLEGYWMEAQSLCQAVDEHLKETQAQYQTLERKYSKAKRLIKEYQQK